MRIRVLRGLSVLAVAMLVAMAAGCSAPPTDLPRPAAGTAIATYLADGSPVFVVSHRDGGLSVLSAVSTHSAWGVHELIAWCPTGRIFNELAHGAIWNESGAYLGGPALGSLTEFAWEDVASGGIRVTGAVGPAVDAPHDNWPGLPATCQAIDRFLFHTFDDLEPVTPAAAIAEARQGWTLVAGWIDVAGGRMCDDLACAAPAPIAGLVTEGQGPPGDPHVSLFVAHARHGELHDLTTVNRSPAD